MMGLMFYCTLSVVVFFSTSALDQRSVDDEYIAQLGPDFTTEDEIQRTPGMTVIQKYHIGSLRFALVKTDSIFRRTKRDIQIKLVPNAIVTRPDIQGLDNRYYYKNVDVTVDSFKNNPSSGCYQQESGLKYWGLSRISSVDRPNFDTAQYLSDKTGQGVNIYVMDSGVNVNHQTFGERAHAGYTVDDLRESEGEMDVGGHGTHVAGLAAGNSDNGDNFDDIFVISPMNVDDNDDRNYNEDSPTDEAAVENDNDNVMKMMNVWLITVLVILVC